MRLWSLRQCGKPEPPCPPGLLKLEAPAALWRDARGQRWPGDLNAVLNLPAARYAACVPHTLENAARFLQRLPAVEAPGQPLALSVGLDRATAAVWRYRADPWAMPGTATDARWSYAVFAATWLWVMSATGRRCACGVYDPQTRPIAIWPPAMGPMTRIVGATYYDSTWLPPQRQFGFQALLQPWLVPAAAWAWLREERAVGAGWVEGTQQLRGRLYELMRDTVGDWFPEGTPAPRPTAIPYRHAPPPAPPAPVVAPDPVIALPPAVADEPPSTNTPPGTAPEKGSVATDAPFAPVADRALPLRDALLAVLQRLVAVETASGRLNQPEGIAWLAGDALWLSGAYLQKYLPRHERRLSWRQVYPTLRQLRISEPTGQEPLQPLRLAHAGWQRDKALLKFPAVLFWPEPSIRPAAFPGTLTPLPGNSRERTVRPGEPPPGDGLPDGPAPVRPR